MKINYINQLQRDILVGYIGNLKPNSNNTSIVEDVSIENKAKIAYKKHSIEDERLSLNEQIQRSGGFIVGFQEGANEMLPIIKELGKALKGAKAILNERDEYQHICEKIQTILKKYKNYL